MDRILIVLCSILGLSMVFLAFPEGAVTVLLVLFLAIPAIFIIRYYSDWYNSVGITEIRACNDSRRGFGVCGKIPIEKKEDNSAAQESVRHFLNKI